MDQSHQKMVETQKTNFDSVFGILCSRYGVCETRMQKIILKNGILDINVDRIKREAWQPLLEAIHQSSDIICISFSSQVDSNIQDVNKKKNQRGSFKSSFEESLRKALCKSLKWLLESTTRLQCLRFRNLCFSLDDLIILKEGIAVNRSLQTFSVENCKVGNEGFKVLSLGLKNSNELKSLNFSECNLTWKAIESLITIIQNHDLIQHEETWKSSLRRGRVHVHEMLGLQEIILSRNSGIGDKGVCILAEALIDNIWIKTVDIQQCGITDDGASALLPLINCKMTPIEFLMNDNPVQDKSLMKNFLLKNTSQSASSFKWKHNHSHFTQEKSAGRILERVQNPQLIRCAEKYKFHPRGKIPSTKFIKIVNTGSKEKNEQVKNTEANKTIKHLQDEVQKYKNLLEKERNTSEELQRKLYILRLENEKVRYLKAEEAKSIEEAAFDQIENTFEKFQSFLNLIKSLKLSDPAFVQQLDALKMGDSHDQAVGLLQEKCEKMQTLDLHKKNQHSTLQKEWQVLRKRDSNLKCDHVNPEIFYHGTGKSEALTLGIPDEKVDGCEDPAMNRQPPHLNLGVLLAPESSSFNFNRRENRDLNSALGRFKSPNVLVQDRLFPDVDDPGEELEHFFQPQKEKQYNYEEKLAAERNELVSTNLSSLHSSATSTSSASQFSLNDFIEEDEF